MDFVLRPIEASATTAISVVEEKVMICRERMRDQVEDVIFWATFRAKANNPWLNPQFGQ